jgi:hypothetical protein
MNSPYTTGQSYTGRPSWDWRQQCPAEPAPCPDITWFWALAAGLGALLLYKRGAQ